MVEVSVALCTYNGERFITRQLESIMEQTLPPKEIVICDDGSSDSTCEIVEGFMERYPGKIKLYRNRERLGRNSNFSQAIGLCNCELIALSDQDDVFARDKLQKLARLIEEDRNCGLAFSNAAVVDESLNVLSDDLFSTIWPPFNRRRKRLLMEGRIYRVLMGNCPAIGCSMMFRSDLRPYILPIPAIFSHDVWIMAIAGLFTDVRFTEERLVFYRQHGRNVAGVQAGLAEKMRARLTLEAQDYYDEVRHSLGCWTLLRERVRGFEGDPMMMGDRYEEALRLMEKRVGYLRDRLNVASLDTSIWGRVYGVAKLSLLNRYHKFGRGSYDLLRDLLAIGLRSRDKFLRFLRRIPG